MHEKKSVLVLLFFIGILAIALFSMYVYILIGMDVSDPQIQSQLAQFNAGTIAEVKRIVVALIEGISAVAGYLMLARGLHYTLFNKKQPTDGARLLAIAAATLVFSGCLHRWLGVLIQ
jgi:hypothetical protein